MPAPDAPRLLELYQFDSCPYCRRVRHHLSQIDLDIPLVDTRQDRQARNRLREATGGTQVPTLFVDGVPLQESLDIIAWLDRYVAANPPR